MFHVKPRHKPLAPGNTPAPVGSASPALSTRDFRTRQPVIQDPPPQQGDWIRSFSPVGAQRGLLVHRVIVPQWVDGRGKKQLEAAGATLPPYPGAPKRGLPTALPVGSGVTGEPDQSLGQEEHTSQLSAAGQRTLTRLRVGRTCGGSRAATGSMLGARWRLVVMCGALPP